MECSGNCEKEGVGDDPNKLIRDIKERLLGDLNEDIEQHSAKSAKLMKAD